MIKKLRVTVDGKSYEVTVETPDEAVNPGAAPPVAAPSRVAAPVPAAVAAPVAKGSAGPGDVPSPLVGRIVGLDVKPGQVVEHGQQLLTIESMKMNTFVLAPKAGKVAEVLVAVGDAVEEGRVLVRIE